MSEVATELAIAVLVRDMSGSALLGPIEMPSNSLVGGLRRLVVARPSCRLQLLFDSRILTDAESLWELGGSGCDSIELIGVFKRSIAWADAGLPICLRLSADDTSVIRE